MDARQDALATAAQVILAVQELANNHPGDPVGTVGKLRLWPNAANVVPGQVERALICATSASRCSMSWWRSWKASSTASAAPVAAPSTCCPSSTLTPAHLSVTDAIANTAQTLGLSCSALPSRAADSQEMGRRWPMGMIFVPSRGGLSHSAAEFTSSRQCAGGTAVLMQSLVRLDQRLNKVPGYDLFDRCP